MNIERTFFDLLLNLVDIRRKSDYSITKMMTTIFRSLTFPMMIFWTTCVCCMYVVTIIIYLKSRVFGAPAVSTALSRRHRFVLHG